MHAERWSGGLGGVLLSRCCGKQPPAAAGWCWTEEMASWTAGLGASCPELPAPANALPCSPTWPPPVCRRWLSGCRSWL